MAWSDRPLLLGVLDEARATRSLTSLRGSRLELGPHAHHRFGDRRGSSTSGVWPIDCTMSPYRPPQGRFLSRSAITSDCIAVVCARGERRL